MELSKGEEKISLWDLSTGLADALAAREEAQTPDEILAADLAIEAYKPAEIAKIDSVAAYLRHCQLMSMAAKMEAERMAKKARAWEGRRKRLLDFVQRCMEAMGRKRLEGRVNTLRLQDNGGLQPVSVQGWDNDAERWTDDPGLLPDHLCWATIRMPYHQWKALKTERYLTSLGEQVRVLRTPNLAEVREALETPCPECEGGCALCGGSGHASVPGATLLPRGSHVRVS